jgi:ferrochelatase
MSEAGRPKRVGILLLQLGGPERQEAVAPFLRNLFSDPDIIPVPGGPGPQKALAWLIGAVRGRKVRGYYRLIGGGSPIRRLTELQAERLESELGRRAAARGKQDPLLRTAVAMRYWHPLTDEALDGLDDADALVALTLFPHYSMATTGSSLKELAAVRERRGDRRPLEIIEHWYDAPDYLDALAERIRRAVDQLSPEGRSGALILWSAHGLPQKIVDAGDPYVDQIKGTVAGTMSRLSDLGLPHRLAYQSRTGPLRWTGPPTEEVLREEASRGRRAMVIVPVSFVSDHIETLYEIDLLYGDEARSHGIGEYVRVESFNGGADLTAVLARLVEERLAQAGWMDVDMVAKQ